MNIILSMLMSTTIFFGIFALMIVLDKWEVKYLPLLTKRLKNYLGLNQGDQDGNI